MTEIINSKYNLKSDLECLRCGKSIPVDKSADLQGLCSSCRRILKGFMRELVESS